MTDPAGRLDRLLPGLSARERAILMLRDFKADKPQDRQLLHTAPDEQADALNRLIGLMNAVNGDLALLIVILHERAEKEHLRFAWLEWARQCALEMWAVGSRFNLSATEPITETDYRRKEAEARSEMIPIDECAMQIAEYHHAFEEADYGTDGEGNRVVADEAWYRVRDEKCIELRELCTAGTLVSSGKSKRLRINCGSFYDWLRESVPVIPDFGVEFDVLPDDRSAEVERRRKDHQFVRSVLDRSACKVDLPLDMEASLAVDHTATFGVETARVLAFTVRARVQENWRELRAIQECLDAIMEDFGGEDVLHPQVRGYFDDAKAALIDLHERVQGYTGMFPLPGTDEVLRHTIEKIVEREVNNVPTRYKRRCWR